MAQTNPNTVITAATVDTIVTINGSTNTVKEFIRAGAIRVINNQYLYVGGSDMVGTRHTPSTGEEILAKGYPMRASSVGLPAYDEVQIGGTWMKILDASKNGLI